MPGNPEARFSVIFVSDLADAITRWLATPGRVNGIFELHDGRAGGYNWRQVIDIVQQLSGRSVRPLPIPLPLMQLPALLNYAAGRLLPYAPMLTPGKIRELRHPDWVCDNHDIEQAIGWCPRTDLKTGLRLTPGWL